MENTMSRAFAQELEIALAAVRVASTICRTVQQTIDLDSMEKDDRSPVTVADYAAQAAICRALNGAFPEDPIVGEEDSADLKKSENAEHLKRIQTELSAVDIPCNADQVCSWIDAGNHDGSSSRFWTLDPIDGTKGFLRKEQFAVSLALIVDGELEVAALACPNLSALDAWDNAQGVVFSAVRGHGAQVSPLDLEGVTPHTVRVASTTQPSQARMCGSVESAHSSQSHTDMVKEHLSMVNDLVRLDSQAKYGVVARGEADIYLRLPTRKGYEEKIWDHAGGALVVTEAGGTVTDVDGKPLDFSKGATLKDNRGVVVSNGIFHDELLEAIRAVGV